MLMKKKEFNALFKDFFSENISVEQKKEIIDILIKDDPNNLSVNSGYEKYSYGNIVYNIIKNNDIELFKYIEEKNLIDFGTFTKNNINLLEIIAFSDLEELKTPYYINKIFNSIDSPVDLDFYIFDKSPDFSLKILNSPFFKKEIFIDEKNQDYFVNYLLNKGNPHLKDIFSKLEISKNFIEDNISLESISKSPYYKETIEVFKEYEIDFNKILKKSSIDTQIYFVKFLEEDRFFALKESGINFSINLNEEDFEDFVSDKYSNIEHVFDLLNINDPLKKWTVEEHKICDGYTPEDLFFICLNYNIECDTENYYNFYIDNYLKKIDTFFDNISVEKLNKLDVILQHNNNTSSSSYKKDFIISKFNLNKVYDFGYEFLLKQNERFSKYVDGLYSRFEEGKFNNEKEEKKEKIKILLKNTLHKYIGKNIFKAPEGLEKTSKVKWNVDFMLDFNQDAYFFDTEEIKNTLIKNGYFIDFSFEKLTTTEPSEKEKLKVYFSQDTDLKIILNFKKNLDNLLDSPEVIKKMTLLEDSLVGIVGKDISSLLRKSVDLLLEDNKYTPECLIKIERFIIAYSLSKDKKIENVIKEKKRL